MRNQQQTTISTSSVLDYLSSSFSNRSNINEQVQQTTKSSTSTQPPEFVVPPAIPSRQLWISDDEVNICMCCNDAQFSMFNRRHHCRRCGRVVCKPCSQQMTVIKGRLERTCKNCFQFMQNNPNPTAASRPEATVPSKKFDSSRQ